MLTTSPLVLYFISLFLFSILDARRTMLSSRYVVPCSRFFFFWHCQQSISSLVYKYLDRLYSVAPVRHFSILILMKWYIKSIYSVQFSVFFWYTSQVQRTLKPRLNGSNYTDDARVCRRCAYWYYSTFWWRYSVETVCGYLFHVPYCFLVYSVVVIQEIEQRYLLLMKYVRLLHIACVQGKWIRYSLVCVTTE